MWQVLKFIWKNTDQRKPTLYRIEHLGYIQGRILQAIASDCFVWKENQYFAAYKVINGLIEVTEASCVRGQMRHMIKDLRTKADFKGACWHRVKSGWKNFPRQESLCTDMTHTVK